MKNLGTRLLKSVWLWPEVSGQNEEESSRKSGLEAKQILNEDNTEAKMDCQDYSVGLHAFDDGTTWRTQKS